MTPEQVRSAAILLSGYESIISLDFGSKMIGRHVGLAMRALYKALARAVHLGASADEHELTALLTDLEPLLDDDGPDSAAQRLERGPR